MKKRKNVFGFVIAILLIMLSFNVNNFYAESRRDGVVRAMSQAILASNSYLISYHTNGGNIIDNDYITSFSEDTVETFLPTPSRNGYKFNGWYLDESFNLESKIDRIDSEVVALARDIDLYASWTPKNYVVNLVNTEGFTYVADTVNGVHKSTHGSSYSIDITLAEGYLKSDDVYLMVNGSNIAYDAKEDYTFMFTIPTSIVNGGDLNITVCGIRLDIVTLSYVYGGDTISDSREHGETYIVSDSLFTRDGYIQTGWLVGTTEYDFGDVITLDSSMEFTPIWATVGYIATFNMNGATSASIEDYSFTVLNTKAIDNPTRTGYTFLGWTGTGLSEPTKDLVIGIGSFGDRHYMANWKLIQYAINYDLDGGVLQNKLNSFTIASADIVLPKPTKAGYSFNGWTKDGASITKIAHGSMGDISVKAHWNILTYDINYDLDGGTFIGTTANTYTVLDEVTFGTPTKEGHIFGGWYQNNSFIGAKVEKISLGSTGNMQVYAKWLISSISSKDKSLKASIVSSAGLENGLTMSISKLKNIFELVKCYEYIEDFDFNDDIKYEVKQVYDINLLSGSAVFDEFSGTYEVRVKLDEFYALTKHARVLTLDESGAVQGLDTHIDGDYLVFTTEHFSRFVFVGESVDTLGNMQWVVFVMVLLMAMGVVVGGTLIVYNCKKEYFHKLFKFISSDLDIK